MADKQEEWKKEYRNKLFFEVFHDAERNRAMLRGPFDNIRYVNKLAGIDTSPHIGYAQIVNGCVYQYFTKDQIIVVDCAENKPSIYDYYAENNK